MDFMISICGDPACQTCPPVPHCSGCRCMAGEHAPNCPRLPSKVKDAIGRFYIDSASCIEYVNMRFAMKDELYDLDEMQKVSNSPFLRT